MGGIIGDMPKPKPNAGTEQLSALLHRLRAPKAAYDPLPTSITIAAARGDVQAATIFLEQGAYIAMHGSSCFSVIVYMKVIKSGRRIV